MPFGQYDPAGRTIDEFKENNISVVVMVLDPDFRPGSLIDRLRNRYTQEGLQVVFVPSYNNDIPTETDLRMAVKTIIEQADSGSNVAVHCHAGVGRTGLVMACLAKEILNLSGDQAIQFVRRYIPGALKTPGQVEAARKY
jgi:protein-tyrosine phosphatase